MRIGVLEWASCGGLAGSAEPADSIRTEGWAMCQAALASLALGGHQAVAVIDPQCAIDLLLTRYRNDELELVDLSAGEDLWNQWQRVYASCDYTLVVAPECNRILTRLLAWCRRNQIPTCNSSDAFVASASDKLITAKLLQSHGLPHPPTQLLVDADRQWPIAAALPVPDLDWSGEPTWVIKPVDGVGCEGTLRVAANELRRHGGFARHAAVTQHGQRGELSELEQQRWIVQPWLSGQALSRSAIVDRSGRLHWLPVTRQHLRVSDRVTYLGGSVEPELAARIPGLDDLLARAVRALDGAPRGWVGVDFLYDEANAEQPVTIIEINPRLTTSFVGLASAGAPDLAATIIAAIDGDSIKLPSQWQPVSFTAAGKCHITLR